MPKNKENAIKERELVIARLEVISPELHFSVGNSSQTYTRDQVISHIKEDDEIGKEFVKTELEFLRALKSGVLINRLVAQ